MRKLAILCSAVLACPVLFAQTPTQTSSTTAAVSPTPQMLTPTPAPLEPPAAPSPAVSDAPALAAAPTPTPDAPTPTASSSPATAIPAASVAPASSTLVGPNGGETIANPTARTVRDFQGEDISMVLRLLARQAGINIVVSDAVAGTINMRVENLTPMEAIRVIVEAKGLDLSQSNNVYFIKTAAEKAKEPTEASCYTFSYANVKDVKDLISKQIQCKAEVQVDIRTNTVFYRDYRSNMANLALFFQSLDLPTKQVMIEARLVEVNANPKQSYGINWGGTVGNSSTAQSFSFGNGVVTAGSNASIGNLSYTTSGHKVSGQLAILTIPEMSATLRLINEDTDAEFLANPRVVTASNLKATIKITRNQPVPKLKYNEQTASTEFDSFEDKIYGNTLEVTPTINKDDFVTMLVKPEISNKVSDESFSISSTTVTSPIIDTRSLESNVVIKSGDTLAIGGLLQDEVSKGRTKVPVLGDIPLLGYAFQERLNTRTKRNLLVFITPTIIRQGYGTGLEDQVSGLKNSGEEYADPNGWRNNARGSIRFVPTSNRQVVSDYPKPGAAPAPRKTRATVHKLVAEPQPAPKTIKKTSVKHTTHPSATPKGTPDYKITLPQREE